MGNLYRKTNAAGLGAGLETPAFILSHPELVKRLQDVVGTLRSAGCRVLYSTKALSLTAALRLIAGEVDGFSTSSLFEAQQSREIYDNCPHLWYTSPLLRDSEADHVSRLCNYVTLNSLSQLTRFGDQLSESSNIGIRVNPQLSFADDHRFDPCRRNSKLGIPVPLLKGQLAESSELAVQVSGLHFHSNCESTNLNELVRTLHHLEKLLGGFHNFHWLNVGGGYLFEDTKGADRLADEIARLSGIYGLTIFAEPGTALVRSAGTFVSTVEDIVEGEDYPVAILDLTINHWPEVYEYGFEPDIEGHVDDGHFTYQLAGCSCLAGDVFGEYSFNEPLEIGSRLVFPNAGAYSIVKSHMFNGISLPNIYVFTNTGDLELIRKFTYDDFLSRNGAVANACFGA